MLTLLGCVSALAAVPDVSETSLSSNPDMPDFDPFVVGGSSAPTGAWPSTVAVVQGSSAICTGTLVAPTVVITAAHCLGGITHVLTGTTSLASGGQLIAVSQQTTHPSYDGTWGSDIAVLTLQSASSAPVVTIANDCIIQDDLYDGAPAAIAGWGAISYDGNQYSNQMHEAFTTIVDHDCSQDFIGNQPTTCDWALRSSDAELFAGGNLIDTCFGDSGGPIYLQDGLGDWYLVGVTSRGAPMPNGNQCGGGGVYVRPDAHMGWIESTTGVTLPRPACGAPPPTPPPTPPAPEDDEPPAPQPTPDETPDETPGGDDPSVGTADWTVSSGPLLVLKDTLGAVQLEIEAADGVVLTFDVVDEPVLGSAEVEPDGQVVFRPTPGSVGYDALTVRVTDASGATADLPIQIEIARRGLACSSTGPMASVLGEWAAWFRRR